MRALYPRKRLFMQRLLFGNYLHIIEHKRIVTEPQSLAAGGCHVPENDFPGFYIRKLLLVGIVDPIRIEIGKYGGTLVVVRMIGVVDMQVFDGDPFGHVTGIAKIMLP